MKTKQTFICGAADTTAATEVSVPMLRASARISTRVAACTGGISAGLCRVVVRLLVYVSII